MSTKGQTINDRLNAAKYTLAGQALARCICKATTEELKRPKKKHLDYLTASTYETNVSMMQLANMLIERTNHSNWAVVYKSLITIHHLMSYGSDRFLQYLASSNYSFQLNSFLNRVVANEHIIWTFIKRYSDYINQKALAYRTLAIDLCKTQRSEDNILRSMPIERLLETLPVVQKQLDVLLDFGCTSNDLNNGIITASFTLLFHDSIRLFASYNDGIINLFEKYFDLNKKMCREAFESYKRFLACTDRVSEFLKVGETINLDRGDMPDFKRAPSSLLDAFESHLVGLEGTKKRGDNKIVIDTKLAAFPSFSGTTSLDFSPSPVATMATEFDELLNLEAAFQTASAAAPTSTTVAESAAADLFSIAPSATITTTTATTIIPKETQAQQLISDQTIAPAPDLTTTLKPTATTTAIATITGLGQTPWPTVVPSATLSSATPITPQLGNINWSSNRPNAPQLGSVNWSSSSTSNSSFQSGNTNWSSMRSNSSQGSGAKAKQESIFEDLEKTMRKSLATSK